MNRITVTLLSLAITVISACGAGATASNDVPVVPVSHTAVSLPDLNDPDVRHRFVCSFGPGSFGTPPVTLGIDHSCPNIADPQP